MSSQLYTPRNILVTGGAGFIGSNFIHFLLRENKKIKIVNLDSLTYAGSLKNLEGLPDPLRYEFVRGTICDPKVVNETLRRYDIDTIIHFAAESHVDRSIDGPAAFVQTNVVGTFALLEAAKQFWLTEKKYDKTECRFHHVSTDEVYGALNLGDSPFTEKTAYAPNSPYSASKAASDHLVRAYHRTYGLPATMSQCSNNYGPRQHSEKLIPTIIRSCRSRQPIPVYGNGANIRDWLYVDDHCAAILAILERGEVGETYAIGGHTELDNLSVAHFICDLMGELYPQAESHRSLIQFVKDRPGHDFRYAIDSSKISSELGWQPKETFKTGIRKTVEYYKK